jgi:hypothetical protein
VLPLTRPWTYLANETVPPLRCRGRSEGTARLLGRRGCPRRPSVIAGSMATAPRDVFGADTCGLRHQREIQPEHAPEGCLRRDQPADKRKKSALRARLSLDNGGPQKGSAGEAHRAPSSKTPADVTPLLPLPLPPRDRTASLQFRGNVIKQVPALPVAYRCVPPLTAGSHYGVVPRPDDASLGFPRSNVLLLPA